MLKYTPIHNLSLKKKLNNHTPFVISSVNKNTCIWKYKSIILFTKFSFEQKQTFVIKNCFVKRQTERILTMLCYNDFPKINEKVLNINRKSPFFLLKITALIATQRWHICTLTVPTKRDCYKRTWKVKCN